MKIIATVTSLALLVLCTAALVRADIARPDPKPPQPRPAKHVITTGLEIVPDSKTYNARLQISEAALKELREATSEGATAGSFGPGINRSSINTIIAGLFLCLSISFGGVWLARSSGKSKSHKAVAAVLVACATVSTASIIAQGNAGPPPSYLWRNMMKNLNANRATGGPINVEIVSEGNGIKLIVPTRDAARATDD